MKGAAMSGRARLFIAALIILPMVFLYGCAGYRAVAETAGPTPGKLVVTNAPKPAPKVMAEGKLVRVNVTTAYFSGVFYYTWQLTLENQGIRRDVPFRTQDLYTFDEGQYYKVLLDTETKEVLVQPAK
jgi:hypothetical protein